jgi:hypothetical protein
MYELKQSYTDEKTGVSYTRKGDYYLPDLTLPHEPEVELGRYGLMRRHYLKEHRKGLFSRMLMNGTLSEHLAEIDRTANARLLEVSRQMANAEGVTEQLKTDDCIVWIQRMTSIRNRAEEIILHDLIYA